MSLCYNCLAVFFLLQLFNQPNIATNKTIQHKLMRLKENNKFFPFYLILTTLSYMVGVDKVVRVISKAHYLLYIAKVGWKGYWPSIGRKYNLSTVHHFLQLRATLRENISDIFCMFNYLSKLFTPQVAVKGNIVFAVLDQTAAVRSAAVSVSCLAEEDPNNPPTIPPPKAWCWPDLNIRIFWIQVW